MTAADQTSVTEWLDQRRLDPADFKPLGHTAEGVTFRYPDEHADSLDNEGWLRVLSVSGPGFRLSPCDAEDLAAWCERYPALRMFTTAAP